MIKKVFNIALAQQSEKTEAAAWIDMVDAANTEYKKSTGLAVEVIEADMYISCPAILFLHFNCVLGFGTNQPVTEQYIENVLAYFRERNLSTVYLFLIDGLHNEAEKTLLNKGFVSSGSWERTWRDDKLPDKTLNTLQPGWSISKVDTANADTWAGFVSGIYQMPATKEWLLDFAVRKGWHHYMLMEANKIIAVRSIFIGGDNMAFWGIEAPIPGLMTNNFAMDFALAHHIVEQGLQMGVKGFVGDIEMISDTESTAAYDNFKALGFSISYRRKIYKLK
jgi:hypothetical protein